MPAKRNNIVPNVHCRKHWNATGAQKGMVKCHFNQTGKKKTRYLARQEKAKVLAPRPTAGLLRPVVRCPTFKYNTKVRAGRGFTLEELKAAGVSAKKALTIGVSVDHRRRNKSAESKQANVQRLKEYAAKLVVLPKKGKGKIDTTLAQVTGFIQPIVKASLREKARVATEAEKNFKAFQTMRIERANAHWCGVRQKRADEKASEAPAKPPKAAAEGADE